LFILNNAVGFSKLPQSGLVILAPISLARRVSGQIGVKSKKQRTLKGCSHFYRYKKRGKTLLLAFSTDLRRPFRTDRVIFVYPDLKIGAI